MRHERHFFKYRSPVDGAEVAFHVVAPAAPPAEPLPVVWLLHDNLPLPTAAEFVEEALKQASAWLPAMQDGAAGLLVQPFGRGNGCWIGPAGRDLFDVRAEVQRRFLVEPGSGSLLGVGAGATGALQLAAWFPHEFAAVAALGPWAEDLFDLPWGVDDWPDWEAPQRRALAPRALATNLANLPVWLEVAVHQHGHAGTATPEHARRLAEALAELKAPATLVESPRRGPSDRHLLWNWLAAARRAPTPAAFGCRAYFPRGAGPPWLNLAQVAEPGKPGAAVLAPRAGGGWSIRTRGVAELKLRRDSAAPYALDGALLPPPTEAEESWRRVEDGWRPVPAPRGGKRAELGGPPFDMFWDAVTIVVGTLGDEAETAAQRAFGADLAARWKSGADSACAHPGAGAVDLEFPVVADRDVADDPPFDQHLVLIGSPWTNLLAARWRERLPVQWNDRQAPMVRGQAYGEPWDTVFALGPHPEAQDRYVFVIAPATPGALPFAARARVATLPDFLALRANQPQAWGYFGADWK